MPNFQFDLVAPDRLLFSGQVRQVDVPGSEGDFGVLAEHAPLIAMLRPGILVIWGEGGAQRIVITGGFAEVTAEMLTVLADSAVPADEFDRAALAEQIARLQGELPGLQGHPYDKALSRLDQLKSLQMALGAGAPAAAH